MGSNSCRSGSEIACEREGRMHDYTRKAGVEDAFIVAPDDAPEWAQDREALWNAAEAKETRSNSVTAREWELALPAELDAGERRLLVTGFAAELVSRYGVAADVAIHAPHRDGDQRNWHAHVLTTTRRLEPSGLTDKTRILDAKQTGGPEIEAIRARWAEIQNDALERHGHEARQERALLVELRARVELARETYTHAREEGADRVTAGLAALRAAAQRHGIDQEHGRKAAEEHTHTLEAGNLRERLARILDRGSAAARLRSREHGPGHGQGDVRKRLGHITR